MLARALGIAALALVGACAAPYAPQEFDFGDAAALQPPFFGTVELGHADAAELPRDGFLLCSVESQRRPTC
jgi:hypothetical protein